MEHEDMLEYLKASEHLEAQETLVRREEALWPWTKRQDRQQRHRKLWKIAYPDDTQRTISVEQLKKLVESGRI
jgi:hypothetical protein